LKLIKINQTLMLACNAELRLAGVSHGGSWAAIKDVLDATAHFPGTHTSINFSNRIPGASRKRLPLLGVNLT